MPRDDVHDMQRSDVNGNLVKTTTAAGATTIYGNYNLLACQEWLHTPTEAGQFHLYTSWKNEEKL